MAPIRKGDGTPIVPKGIQQVRTGDGRVLFDGDDTPDSGLYLDDWADNKLTSRDGYDETELNSENLEPESSDFADPIRPEYTEISGSPTAENAVLKTGDEDEALTSFTVDVTANQLTWEWEWQYQQTTDTGGVWFYPFVEQIANRTFGRPEEGYHVQINDTTDTDFQLFRMDGGGDNTVLISGSWPGDTDPHTGIVTRSSDGNWELFMDGTSQGTATDTTFTNPSYSGFYNNVGVDAHFDDFRVF